MAKIISEIVDYPNMTAAEIIKSDICLSGDALKKFSEDSFQDGYNQGVEDIKCDLHNDVVKFESDINSQVSKLKNILSSELDKIKDFLL